MLKELPRSSHGKSCTFSELDRPRIFFFWLGSFSGETRQVGLHVRMWALSLIAGMSLSEILILTGLNILFLPSGNYTSALFLEVQSADPGGLPHSLFLLVIRCHLPFPQCWPLHTMHWWDRGCNWVKLMNSGHDSKLSKQPHSLPPGSLSRTTKNQDENLVLLNLELTCLYKILHDDMTSVAHWGMVVAPRKNARGWFEAELAALHWNNHPDLKEHLTDICWEIMFSPGFWADIFSKVDEWSLSLQEKTSGCIHDQG